MQYASSTMSPVLVASDGVLRTLPVLGLILSSLISLILLLIILLIGIRLLVLSLLIG